MANGPEIEYMWQDRKRIWFFGLPWTFTKYALNEERFFIEQGFLNKRENEVRLYRIMDVSLKRTLWQRIIGVGTIKCSSGDKTMGNFEIKNIKNPKLVKEMLSQQVEKEREAKRVLSREYMTNEEDGEFDDHN